MTGAGDFLARIIDRFERAGIEHMVAGSFASTLHGIPRTTRDIDLVIAASMAQAVAFVRSLPETEYYVDEEAARTAVRDCGQFNVIDNETGWKADLIVRKNRPFSVEEFCRRVPVRMLGVNVYVATAEDTIIAKLEWDRLSGGSERQRADVAGIVALGGADLDRGHIERWCAELGTLDLWKELASGSSE